MRVSTDSRSTRLDALDCTKPLGAFQEHLDVDFSLACIFVLILTADLP